jgi:hypothetical protein
MSGQGLPAATETGYVGPRGERPPPDAAPVFPPAPGTADMNGRRAVPPSGVTPLDPITDPQPDDGRVSPASGVTVFPALGRPAQVDGGAYSNGMSNSPGPGPASDRSASSHRSPDPVRAWPGPDQHAAGERFPFAGPPGRGAVDPRSSAVPRPVQPSPLSGPITQPTIMLRPFDPPFPGSTSPPETGREAFVDNQHEHGDSHETGPSLVRPYARTGGRTKPGRDLALEALVSATVSGRDSWQNPMLNPEHASVIELCSGTVSVAEIAARLAVPLGVARVIIADMVDLGLVEVMKTSSSVGDERDPAFLRRVLSGLQRL